MPWVAVRIDHVMLWMGTGPYFGASVFFRAEYSSPIFQPPCTSISQIIDLVPTLPVVSDYDKSFA